MLRLIIAFAAKADRCDLQIVPFPPLSGTVAAGGGRLPAGGANETGAREVAARAGAVPPHQHKAAPVAGAATDDLWSVFD